MNNYDEQIEKLVKGEIKEISVSHENFMEFRAAWIKWEDKKFIVEAAHHGNVVYRYDPTVL